MKRPRIIRKLANVIEALARVAERDVGPRFCRNCGDAFDDDASNAALDKPSGSWRPCPSPSPGRPMIDCGIGGHMYTDSEPRID